MEAADTEVARISSAKSLTNSRTGSPAGTANCRSLEWEARISESDISGIQVRKHALRRGTPKDENVVQPDIVGWHRGRPILGATSLIIRRTGISASTPNCRSLKREARGSVFDRMGIHVSHNLVQKE